MSETSWKVEVDGNPHTISVHPDPESGRSAVRVDGRAAARPLSAEDEEREVPVGNTRYLIRRLADGTFDLDLAPVTLDPALHPPEVQIQQKPAKSSNLKWLVIVAIVVAAGLFGRSTLRFLQYANVRWTPYAPADETFKAKFAGQPAEETKSKNVGGEMWQVTHLSSIYKDHAYAIDYVDVRRVVTAAGAQPLIEDYFKRWTEGMNATVVSQEEASLAGNPAIKFVLRVPVEGNEAATTRGVIAIRNKRVFFVYAIAPETHKSTPDLASFISGFELQPPPPAKLHL